VRDAILPEVYLFFVKAKVTFCSDLFILKQIEEDEPSEFIKYSKFEPYMLKGIIFTHNIN